MISSFNNQHIIYNLPNQVYTLLVNRIIVLIELDLQNGGNLRHSDFTDNFVSE